MAKKNTETYRDSYEEFCKTLKVYDLIVESLNYKRSGFPDLDGHLKMSMFGKASNCTYHYDSEDFLVIDIPLELKVVKIDKDDKKKKETIFTLKAGYNLICKSRIILDDDIFKKFAEEELPEYFYPYFRELVQQSLLRTGLPPLMLPVAKN